jgi:guanylate kinase
MYKGILVVLSGPSGAGKGTVSQALLPKMKEMFLSVSATTRMPRNGEIDGEDYLFITVSKFSGMIAGNEFLEWAKVHDNYYGTPCSPVREALKQGKDVLLEIDIQGGLQVKKKIPEAVLIFLLPPSWTELKARLNGRGSETPKEVKKRLQNAVNEIRMLSLYDYVIVNDRVEQAVDRIQAIIAAEKCRTFRFQKNTHFRLDVGGCNESTISGQIDEKSG